MIKLIFCLRRKEGMSVAQFQSYWSEKHAPLVERHKDVLGIRRYVQSHSRESALSLMIGASRQGVAKEPAAPYDGVAELWYDSIEAMTANADNPDVKAAGKALLDDEAKFIDLANSPIFLSEEIEVI
ncbi:MAG: EthD domain-containing protein [Erythrobacter sp.]